MRLGVAVEQSSARGPCKGMPEKSHGENIQKGVGQECSVIMCPRSQRQSAGPCSVIEAERFPSRLRMNHIDTSAMPDSTK